MINFILEYWFIAALVVAVWAFNEARKITAKRQKQVDYLIAKNMKNIPLK